MQPLRDLAVGMAVTQERFITRFNRHLRASGEWRAEKINE